MELRPYQQHCLDAINKTYQRGITKQLIVLPTGTGKTIVFATFIKRQTDFGWPSLVLVHRDELITQTADKLRVIGVSPDTIGIVKGERNDTDRLVTVASVQTLNREKRLNAFIEANPPRLLVIDEAHHASAKSYRRVIEKVEPDLLLGFTATPIRLDKKSLVGNVFDQVVYHRSIMEMVLADYLVPPKPKFVQTGVDLDERHVRTVRGDFDQHLLGIAVNDSSRHEKIVKSYQEFASERKAIVFTVDVENVKALTEAFVREGVRVQGIYGGLSMSERRDILNAYKNRDLDVLVNCEILTEGFDDPETDCVIMARPTQSAALYVQMIGRALRLYPGKRDALIIDITDNSRKHSIGLSDIVPEARTPQELLREMPRAQLEFFKQMQSDGGERGSHGWLEGDATDLEEFGLYHDPHFRWIKYGEEGYSLSVGNGESVHLIRGAVSGNMLGLSSKHEWVIEHPIPPEFAFYIAEQWGQNRAKQLGLKKPYGWTEPRWWDLFPTEKQRAFAKKLGANAGMSIAETSFNIDRHTLRPKFVSALAWLDRNFNGLDL
ncbi:UvrABC system protein B [Peptococcaceae bacterium CEB3]|nr:UvrABC system protein B [Peptococcaceae bacterium CEB3]